MLALDKQIYPNDQFWDLFLLYLTIIDIITCQKFSYSALSLSHHL
jgi:hypothetical protein